VNEVKLSRTTLGDIVYNTMERCEIRWNLFCSSKKWWNLFYQISSNVVISVRPVYDDWDGINLLFAGFL